jgi:hypothetical protein
MPHWKLSTNIFLTQAIVAQAYRQTQDILLKIQPRPHPALNFFNSAGQPFAINLFY